MRQLATIRDSLQCGFHDWMDIWGDPWLSGSILVMSYLVSGVLVLRTANKLAGRERSYWSLCGALLVFQAANTPLDLHAFVWTTGRCLAHAQGWYAQRQSVQVFFLLSAAVIAAILCTIVLWRLASSVVRNLLLTMGMAICLGFTLVKGVSLHELAAFYGQPIGPFYVADVIEWSGVLLAFFAAMSRARQLSIAQENAD